MDSYQTLESWASRLGYIVERTENGWLCYRENDPIQEFSTAKEVIEAILLSIRLEYGGEE